MMGVLVMAGFAGLFSFWTSEAAASSTFAEARIELTSEFSLIVCAFRLSLSTVCVGKDSGWNYTAFSNASSIEPGLLSLVLLSLVASNALFNASSRYFALSLIALAVLSYFCFYMRS